MSLMNLDPELLKQLLETFKVELSEQSQVIVDGLLRLEKVKDHPEEKSKIIEAIFRSAHNIKGASRGLGVNDIGEIAHHIESLYSNIKSNKLELTPAIIDLCLEAVDKMDSAMKSFVNKSPLSFNLQEFTEKLTNVGVDKPAQPVAKEIKNDELEAKIVDTQAKVESDANESIRVNITKIDKIFALLEEIQINKIAIEDQFNELSHVVAKNKELLSCWKHIFDLAKKQQDMSDMDENFKLYHTSNDCIIELNHITSHLQKSMRFQLNELTILSNSLQDEIRMLRLIPAGNLLRTFPRYVRDISRDLNKEIELKIDGDEVKLDKLILEGLKDPLIHILRNSIDHGIESSDIRQALGKSKIGHINLSVMDEGNQIYITVSDDGGGIDIEKIKSTIINKNLATSSEIQQMNEEQILDYIFRSGFSTKNIITDISGRGVGLDVVKSNLADLKGDVSVITKLGAGTTMCLCVPLTLSSERGLLVNSGKQLFVIPTNSVKRVLVIQSTDIADVEGCQALLLDNHSIPLRVLTDVLKMTDDRIKEKDRLSIVLLEKGWHTVALLVDEIIGEREIVIKPLRPPLANISCVAGGTLLEHNQVAIVLNASDLINQALNSSVKRVELEDKQKQTKSRPHILVVDDSITTRTLEKNILESHNYQVTITVNGKEAWDLLQKQKFSLLITDVNMPIMDGFTLTEQVKTSDQLRDLPVIIVTSLGSDAEKARGVAAGANAYIVKSEFESGALLDIVGQLV